MREVTNAYAFLDTKEKAVKVDISCTYFAAVCRLPGLRGQSVIGYVVANAFNSKWQMLKKSAILNLISWLI